jgi:hypothetical protein
MLVKITPRTRRSHHLIVDMLWDLIIVVRLALCEADGEGFGVRVVIN